MTSCAAGKEYAARVPHDCGPLARNALATGCGYPQPWIFSICRNKSADAPLVIWLTGQRRGKLFSSMALDACFSSCTAVVHRFAPPCAGGPGCSSEIAVFAENGPFQITMHGEIEERKYGWDNEVPPSLLAWPPHVVSQDMVRYKCNPMAVFICNLEALAALRRLTWCVALWTTCSF